MEKRQPRGLSEFLYNDDGVNEVSRQITDSYFSGVHGHSEFGSLLASQENEAE
ncbi:hypothetical protein [Bacillus sp. T33-2]|uniref:hypothetical protein n=1 Tax=Bacillus sp. T33-2 TaxID=2054168 RepID=UPI0015E0CF8B|nr:hypothetical protein [Bacillus sp. T33-2]